MADKKTKEQLYEENKDTTFILADFVFGTDGDYGIEGYQSICEDIHITKGFALNDCDGVVNFLDEIDKKIKVPEHRKELEKELHKLLKELKKVVNTRLRNFEENYICKHLDRNYDNTSLEIYFAYKDTFLDMLNESISNHEKAIEEQKKQVEDINNLFNKRA